MRLIDADKLQAKHYLQRTEHPIGYEGTQAVYDYTDILAYDIESAEIVEAIPIEFIEEYIKYQDTEEQKVLRMMWHAWELREKENEKR